MDSSTKRWTFTLSKFDEPFGVRFHFENFWEPMSIGVKVILLVGYDKTMYTCINEKIDSHITENLTSLSAFGSILKIFGNRCRLM
jgi:hypothetical protein